MTTVAEMKKSMKWHRQSGQSVIELLLSLPLLLGVVLVVTRVNAAIQTSIVHQKYARSHLLFLAYNSPYFPESRFRNTGSPSLNDLGVNQFNIAVSENVVRDEAAHLPYAPIYNITRHPVRLSEESEIIAGSQDPTKIGDNRKQEIADFRGLVRVRTSATLCMEQSGVLSVDSNQKPVVLNPRNGQAEPLSYCRRPIGE